MPILITFLVTFLVSFVFFYFKGLDLLLRIPIFYKFIISVFIISITPLVVITVNRTKALKILIFSKEVAVLDSVADLKESLVSDYFEHVSNDIYNLQNSFLIKDNYQDLLRTSSLKNQEIAKKNLDETFINYTNRDGFQDIFILDREKNILYATNMHFGSLDLAKFGELKLSESEILISDPVKINGYVYIYSSGPITSDGKLLGYGISILDMTEIFSKIRNTKGLGETGETVLAKEINGETVVINQLRSQSNSSLDIKASVDMKTITTDYKNNKVISSWRYIPSYNAYLQVKKDYNESLKPVTDLRNIVIIFLSVVSILVLIISYIISSLVLKRLTKMADVIEKVSEGETIDWKFLQDPGEDEVGKIIRGVRKMVEDMNKVQDELNIKINELNRFIKVSVGRELRMAELKEEMKTLKNKTK